MRTISLEEHFITPEFLKATGRGHYQANDNSQGVFSKLLDIGEGRIADMDAGKINMQVLSLSSGGLDKLDPATSIALVHDIHDKLAAAVSIHPDRFAAFASATLQDPEQAALELERCIKELRFKGLLVNGTVNGVFLDDLRFTPIFETAQALDVPIYMHPGFPPKPVVDAYYSGLPGSMGLGLSIAGYGWHAETGLHCLRLMVSGVFDRFPKLKIIVGHMGDHLPFNIARADRVLGGMAKDDSKPPFKRSIIEYFRENFYVTTSGYFDIHPFNCALGVLGADHILFSVDYPYTSNILGYEFISTLPVSPENIEKIAHGNAERLLKL
ncbi:MAG: amidohydrolase family protein [Dehalococcoidia bacterium]